MPTSLGKYWRKQEFFYQRLGPNYFTNKGPRRFPTVDLGGLIEDVRQNKFLDLVTMPRQRNNQENFNTWATHRVKGQGGGMQANGGFYDSVQSPTGPDPYSTQEGNGYRYQTPQGKGWQAPNPEYLHIVLIKFMVSFLQKYATPYFAK